MKSCSKIIDIIKKKFTISLEVIPPRNGASFESVKKQILLLASESPDFISVTKGAGGSLRGGSLPIAHFIQNHLMIPALAHFTCRDYTIPEVENSLIDHHYFGINNILALRGDPPAGLQSEYIPKENSYPYAYNLVEHINNMNRGYYLSRKGFDDSSSKLIHKDDATDFCIGVACYPEFADMEKSVEYLKVKIDQGAHYAVTQMTYDADNYLQYRDKFDIPILPGLHMITSLSSAKFLQTHMDIILPPDIESLMAEKQKMIEFMINMVQKLKKEGAPGVHFFVINNIEDTIKILKEIA